MRAQKLVPARDFRPQTHTLVAAAGVAQYHRPAPDQVEAHQYHRTQAVRQADPPPPHPTLPAQVEVPPSLPCRATKAEAPQSPQAGHCLMASPQNACRPVTTLSFLTDHQAQGQRAQIGGPGGQPSRCVLSLSRLYHPLPPSQRSLSHLSASRSSYLRLSFLSLAGCSPMTLPPRSNRLQRPLPTLL